MNRRITIIQGHPDATVGHFGHALSRTYAQGAEKAGHAVRTIDVADLDFPWLRSKEDWNGAGTPEAIWPAQEAIKWADHLVIFYPLWLGTMPALLKAFFEQAFRPGFAFSEPLSGKVWKKLLKGRSARIVVTMGMPALAYRWYFRAHSLKSLERNILGFCGIGPISETLIGMIEHADGDRREKWLERMYAFGTEGR